MTTHLENAPAHYPEHPGAKVGGTSAAAAIAMAEKAPTLRDQVKALLAEGLELTPDEAASMLGRSPFQIRPRFSELVNFKEIEETGEVRINPTSGKDANVYRIKQKAA